jgi:hypothetical protein
MLLGSAFTLIAAVVPRHEEPAAIQAVVPRHEEPAAVQVKDLETFGPIRIDHSNDPSPPSPPYPPSPPPMFPQNAIPRSSANAKGAVRLDTVNGVIPVIGNADPRLQRPTIGHAGQPIAPPAPHPPWLPFRPPPPPPERPMPLPPQPPLSPPASPPPPTLSPPPPLSPWPCPRPDGAPPSEAAALAVGEGWLAGEKGGSCVCACQAVGLRCNEDAMFAHNDQVRARTHTLCLQPSTRLLSISLLT